MHAIFGGLMNKNITFQDLEFIVVDGNVVPDWLHEIRQRKPSSRCAPSRADILAREQRKRDHREYSDERQRWL